MEEQPQHGENVVVSEPEEESINSNAREDTRPNDGYCEGQEREEENESNNQMGDGREQVDDHMGTELTKEMGGNEGQETEGTNVEGEESSADLADNGDVGTVHDTTAGVVTRGSYKRNREGCVGGLTRTNFRKENDIFLELLTHNYLGNFCEY